MLVCTDFEMGDTHMRLIPMAAVLMVALVIPSVVINWGNERHRIVGDIAWYYISPETKSEVLGSCRTTATEDESVVAES